MRSLCLALASLLACLPATVAGAQPAGGVAGSGMGQGEASVTSRADVRFAVESGPATSSEKLAAIAANLSGALNDIRACYVRIAGARAVAEGVMRVRIALPAGSRGVDTEVTVDRVNDAELSRCVTRIVRAPAFRDVQRPATAFVSLEFTNSAAAGTRAVQEARAAADFVRTGPDGVARAVGQTATGEVRFSATAEGATSRDALVGLGRALNARLGSLLDCRRRASRRGANPQGEITLTLRIAGRRRTPAVVSGTVASPDGGRCVSTLLARGNLEGAPDAGEFRIVVTFAGIDATGPGAPPR